MAKIAVDQGIQMDIQSGLIVEQQCYAQVRTKGFSIRHKECTGSLAIVSGFFLGSIFFSDENLIINFFQKIVLKAFKALSKKH